MNRPALRENGGGKAEETSPSLRFNLLAALVCRWMFAHVRVDAGAVERLRALAARGTPVYAMRHRSVVDYLLAVHVLQREGLPVPEFVNDTPTLLMRPLREIAATVIDRLRTWRRVGRGARGFEERNRCHRLVRAGRSVLTFTRGRRPLRPFATARGVAVGSRAGSHYLQEIVHDLWTRKQTVFVVPLAVLRGKGFRRRDSRIATLLYTVQEAPGEVRRLLSAVWNRQDTQLSIGNGIPLRDFMEAHRCEGETRIVKRLVRALQVFLYREERTVWGPPLLAKRDVRRLVLQGDDLAAVIHRVARERNETESKAWRMAERYFDEMAANFNSVYFAILEYAFNHIWPRVFQGLEYRGLEQVVECVKKAPVVLVPCHRSHFDYLILSYIFHNNHLSPPHIAAGINMSFWPLGPLFRGAGAYFIRRSFEGDPLYKVVFCKYLTFLIREGYTQEFFIEGGRSRTGKILTPKLGMLSAIVNSFIDGVRRDLYLVPVSIHYGRIVEEEVYSRELRGAEKGRESLGSLFKARAVLRQKYGTAYVTFARPISLHAALGERKQRFRQRRAEEAVEEERRRFVQKLGFRLLRTVNEVAVAGATSVSASILLAAPHAAIRARDFLIGAQALVRYLRARGVRFTASLERNAAHGFRESIAFLEAGGLVRRLADPDGSVLFVPAQKRQALDFYKNNSIHFFLLPAVVSRALVRGARGPTLQGEVAWWLEVFRWEFALPERGDLAAELRRVLDYLRREGALRSGEGEALDAGQPFIRATAGLLENFQEAYWMVARSLAELERPITRRVLIDLIRKRYETALLLGEVSKPEGNSTVTLGNAVDRFREMGFVAVQAAARGRARVARGPAFDELPELIGRLAPDRVHGGNWPVVTAGDI